MNKVFNKFNSLNLYKKIFYINILVMFVFVCMLVVIQFAFVNRYVIEQHTYAIRNNHKQTIRQIEQQVENYSEMLNLIENNEVISDFIINGSGYKTPDVDLEEYRRQLKFNNSIGEILSPLDVKEYGIYTSDGYIYTNHGLYEFSNSDMKHTAWHSVVKEAFGRTFFCDASYFAEQEAADENYIYCIKAIKDGGVDNYVGAIRLGIPKDLLESFMIACCITEDCSAVIYNVNNEVMLSYGENAVQLIGNNADFLNSVAVGESIIFRDTDSRNEYITVKASVELTNWEMYVFLPVYKLLESYAALTWRIFGIVILVFILIMFVVRKIYMSYTKRLNIFVDTMKKYKEGELCLLDVDGVYDDIGQCIDAYNLMVVNIRRMLKEQIDTKEKLHEYDIKILYERVNPHFLYNTLEIINSMAVDEGIDSISETVQKLADYYRISLNNIRDVLTLEQEIKHSELYLDIANRRFDKNIQFYCEIPDEMMDIEVLKMMLQPVIENSVRHGFLKKDSGDDNEIVIAAYYRDGYVDIEVTDNGIGIDDETLVSLNNMKLKKEVEGIGLRSTDERIKLFYGNDCGISVRSELGISTTVVLRIKKSRRHFQYEDYATNNAILY